MVRTRRGLGASAGGPAGSSPSLNRETNASYNGSSNKASPQAVAAASSASASRNTSETMSGYSTPLTSNGPTPVSDQSLTNIEIVIPTSSKMRTNGISPIQKAANYMLGNGSKRKRQTMVISDSEEDEEFSDTAGNSARTRHDAKVARQLQEEFDREAALALFKSEDEAQEKDHNSSFKKQKLINPKNKTLLRRIPIQTSDSDSDDDDDAPVASSSRNTKGKTRGDVEVEDPSEQAGDTPEPVRSYYAAVYGADDSDSNLSSVMFPYSDDDGDDDDSVVEVHSQPINNTANRRRGFGAHKSEKAANTIRRKLVKFHPCINTMWPALEETAPIDAGKAEQPQMISRLLKPFQLAGLAWMQSMEQSKWKGGLLGDEMGLGKTIQAVSLIVSDYPAKQPTLVLVPPVALAQWRDEIESYTSGKLKTLVWHATTIKTKGMTTKDIKKYDVILMSYNTLASMYKKQEQGFTRKNGVHMEKSVIHSTHFHRVILDEAHCIKTPTTQTARSCYALKRTYSWCLSGTPLQNRIGEFFSLLRFLDVQPFSSYLCKECPCERKAGEEHEDAKCPHCKHNFIQHVSIFNYEILGPIQRAGDSGEGREGFRKLRLLTSRLMLRRIKKDHTNAMDLPVKEVYVDRQFFGEAENDFAHSIMANGQRKFDTYVAQGVLLNNYANIFGLIMKMRQVADHPDLILKKDGEGGQNILHCIICDEAAEEAIRSRCKHDFCRACAKAYLNSQDQPDCPRCHIPLSIDLDQPSMEQDELLVKKSSIINRINMEKWTSSTKIELLVHQLHQLRSDKGTHKTIIFSQFTSMLQLIEWRLRRAGISTVMLDGSMTPAQRAASIDHFMTDVNTECFLVSLRAGGVALNLTEASHVFIVDPWWNPASEWQSADRCHRIGQSRPCTITRLCIEDSIESRMVLLQEKKTNMINSTINSDQGAMQSLTPQDLQFLFRGS